MLASPVPLHPHTSDILCPIESATLCHHFIDVIVLMRMMMVLMMTTMMIGERWPRRRHQLFSIAPRNHIKWRLSLLFSGVCVGVSFVCVLLFFIFISDLALFFFSLGVYLLFSKKTQYEREREKRRERARTRVMSSKCICLEPAKSKT